MPIDDGLTNKFRKQLADSGLFESDDEISGFLDRQNLTAASSAPTPTAGEAPSATTVAPSLEEQRRRLVEAGIIAPDIENLGERGNAQRAVGSFVWGFSDTASFGLLGAVDRKLMGDGLSNLLVGPSPETDRNLADIWGGAIGGLVGFVAGAPMKIGAKAAAAVARPFIKSKGFQYLPDVAKSMMQTGVSKGLTKDQAKAVVGMYTNVQKGGKFKKNIFKDDGFAKAVNKNIEDMIQQGLMGRKLTEIEANAIRAMVKNNVSKRPMGDFVDIFINKYPGGAKGLVLGSMVNEAIMFGMIDTVFEGVTTFKEDEHEFDWMAPMWGGVVGVGFGALKGFPMAGKRAPVKRDFMDGLKSWMDTSFIKNLTPRKAQDRALGLGTILKDATPSKAINKPYLVDIPYIGSKGKLVGEKITVDLRDVHNLHKKVVNGVTLGKVDADVMVKAALEKTQKEYGAKLLRWSIGEEMGSIARNWHRMLAGSAVMNARTIYDSFVNDVDFDWEEALPHLLIGAWVSRHGRPQSWDLNNYGHVDRLRQNLSLLGVPVRNLHAIPALAMDRTPSYRNAILQDARYDPLMSTAEKLNIVSDETRVLDRETLKKDEVSVSESESSQRDLFNVIWNELNGTKNYIRGQDQITEREMLQIVNKFKEIHPEVKTAAEATEIFRNWSQESTTSIENRLEESAVELSNLLKFDINTETGGSKLPFISTDTSVTKEIGDESHLIMMKANNILNLLRDGTGTGKHSKDTRDSRVVTTSEEYNTIKSIVDKFEDSINQGSERISFDLIESYHDLMVPMLLNRMARTSEAVSGIFGKDDPDHNKLIDMLRNAGLFKAEVMEPGPDGKTRVRNVFVTNTDKIVIIGAPSEAEAAHAKKLIGFAINMLAAKNVGEKDPYHPSNYHPSSVQEGTEIKIQYNSIMGSGPKEMSGFLNRKGMRTDEYMLNMFSDELTRSVLQDKVSNTELTAHDVAEILDIANKGADLAGFETSPTKGTMGFWLRKAKVAVDTNIPIGDASMIKDEVTKHNESVDRIVGNSGGLVAERPETVIIKTKQEAALLGLRLLSESDSITAKEQVASILGTLDVREGPLSKSISELVTNGGSDVAKGTLAWFLEMGLVTKKITGGKVEYQAHYEKLNDAMKEQLKDRVRKLSSLTVKEMDSLITQNKLKAQDALSETDRYEGDRSLTLSGFFKEYSFGDSHPTKADDMGEVVNNWLFTQKGTVRKNVHAHIRNKIVVGEKKFVDHYKDDPVKLHKLDVDITRTLLTRVMSESIPLIEITNRQVRTDKKAVQQKTKLTDILKEIFGSYFAVAGETASFHASPNGYKFSRHIYNVFEAPGNLPDRIKKQLELERTSWSKLLVYPVTINEETYNKGLILFDKIAPGIQPFALDRNIMPKLVAEYNNLVREVLKYSKEKGIEINTDSLREMFEEQTRLNGGKLGVGMEVITTDESKRDERGIVEEVTNNGQMIKIEGIDSLVPVGDLRAMVDGKVVDPDPANAEYREAMSRVLLSKMVVGSDGKYDTYIEALNSDDISKWTKRYNLYDTKAFSRESAEIMSGRKMSTEEKRVFDKFQSTGDVGVARWDDKGMADVQDWVSNQLKRYELEWDSLLNGRSSESGFDSITFISRDYMTYLSMMHGFENPETHNLLKPVIGSNGKDILLFGKTLFVYDPYLNDFFGRPENADVDILMTQTASKIVDKDWNPISDLTVESLPNSAVAKEYIRRIPLSAVAVKADNYSSGVPRKSQSLYSTMNATELSAVYRAEYKGMVDDAFDIFKDVYNTPQGRNAILKAALFDTPQELDMLGSEGGQGRSSEIISGLHQYLENNPYADPNFYSVDIVKNTLYEKLIEPIIHQRGRVKTSPGQFVTHGGKAVIIQSLDPKYRNLDATIVDSSGNVRQIGEAVLPYSASEITLAELLKSGTNQEVRFVDKRRDVPFDERIKTIEEMGEIDPLFKEQFDWLVKLGGDFGGLVMMVEGSDYDVSVMTNRYPRTRPNDLNYQRVRGFLEETYGNSMIVNEMDVLNVFEGDYDVDRHDFYVTHSKPMWDHASRATNKFWVQGVDPESLNVASGVNFKMTPNVSDMARGKYVADTMIIKKAVGLGQKTGRLLNHLSQLFPQNKAGRYVVYETTVDGKQVTIEMDYENKRQFHRLALETQLILDAGNKVNPEIFESPLEWRDNILFPTMRESAELTNIGFQQASNLNKDRLRPRIFRKSVEGKEVDLSTADIAILKALIGNYAQFLQLSPGVEMYDGTGEHRKPTYKQRMEVTGDFLRFMENIGAGVYDVVKRNPAMKGRSSNFRNEINRMFRPKDKKTKSGKTYWQNRTSPWDTPESNIVERNAQDISNGSAGQPIERILQKMYALDKTGLNSAGHDQIIGEMIEVMDAEYAKLVAGDHGVTPDGKSIEWKLDDYKKAVIDTVKDLNSAVAALSNLKMKFGGLSKIKDPEQRSAAIRRHNEAEAALNKKVWDMLPGEYKKTRKRKDLPKLIKYVHLGSNEELQRATQQHFTLASLLGADHSGGYDRTLENSGTNSGNKRVSLLKSIWKVFWADHHGNLDTTLQYGAATVQREAVREYFTGFPDQATFRDVFYDLLDKAVNDHDLTVLWKFAHDKPDTGKIGVIDGTPVVVPFVGEHGPSKRYQLVVQYLASRAVDVNPDIAFSANEALKLLQNKQTDWQQLFLKNPEMVGIRYDAYGDVVPNRDVLSIPKFKSYIEKGVYDRMSNIDFGVGNKIALKDPLRLWDDPLIAFYGAVFKAAGRSEDFRQYTEKISYLARQQMKAGYIDPIKYLAVIGSLEKDIHKAVSDTIEEGIDMSPTNVMAQDLRTNQMWIALGGSAFANGKKLSLNPIRRLSQQELASNVQFAAMGQDIINKKNTSALRKLEDQRAACRRGLVA